MYYINNYLTMSSVHKSLTGKVNLEKIMNRALKDFYVWIDLEMTGLDPAKDTILEIACMVTTPCLKPVNDGINLTIHQTDSVLDKMNDWCKVQFSKNGLTEACRKSTISLSEAEIQVSDYIKKNTESCKGDRYLAGNSVHIDKIFLMKYMPKIVDLLHYRIIDVSSIKVLCKNWYPSEFGQFQKKIDHRALDDIKNSTEELKHYRSNFFK